MSEPKTRRQFYFPTVLAVVVVDASDYWMDFKIYGVAAWDDDETPMFAKGNELMANGTTFLISEALPIIDGFVKWDGCCEVSMSGDHFCGRVRLAMTVGLMPMMHDLAAVVMANWDGLGEKVEPLPEHVEFTGDSLEALRGKGKP